MFRILKPLCLSTLILGLVPHSYSAAAVRGRAGACQLMFGLDQGRGLKDPASFSKIEKVKPADYFNEADFKRSFDYRVEFQISAVVGADAVITSQIAGSSSFCPRSMLSIASW